jgi:hypothetical protein
MASAFNESPTRRYLFDSGQRLTTSGAAAVRSAALPQCERVCLHASGRGFFRLGDSAVTATVGAASMPLEAGEKFHLDVNVGEFISWIRDGASDVSLTIIGCN